MKEEDKKVEWYGYVALIIAIIFFSGIFSGAEGPLRAFDFGNVVGVFGSMGTLENADVGTLASDFRGIGGSGAKDGWLFGLTLAPAVMAAIGMVKVLEHLQGLKAAQNMLTPLLRPLMGIPGSCGLALIASLQSTDAGGSMTKEMLEEGYITEKEQAVFCAFQFSGGALLTNYLSSGAALFGFLDITMSIPLLVIFIFKFIGANMMRFYVSKFVKEE